MTYDVIFKMLSIPSKKSRAIYHLNFIAHYDNIYKNSKYFSRIFIFIVRKWNENLNEQSLDQIIIYKNLKFNSIRSNIEIKFSFDPAKRYTNNEKHDKLTLSSNHHRIHHKARSRKTREWRKGEKIDERLSFTLSESGIKVERNKKR